MSEAFYRDGVLLLAASDLPAPLALTLSPSYLLAISSDSLADPSSLPLPPPPVALPSAPSAPLPPALPPTFASPSSPFPAPFEGALVPAVPSSSSGYYTPAQVSYCRSFSLSSIFLSISVHHSLLSLSSRHYTLTQVSCCSFFSLYLSASVSVAIPSLHRLCSFF